MNQYPDGDDMDDPFLGIHNPTVYSSRSEMKAMEDELPFTDEIEDGCWNCLLYDGNRCTKDWNNNDPCYYFPDRDDKDPLDCCEDYQKDETVTPEDYFF